jgi:hypothetical protein
MCLSHLDNVTSYERTTYESMVHFDGGVAIVQYRVNLAGTYRADERGQMPRNMR